MKNFDSLWAGKGDYWELENRTVHGNWTLDMVGKSIFPTCSGV